MTAVCGAWSIQVVRASQGFRHRFQAAAIVLVLYSAVNTELRKSRHEFPNAQTITYLSSIPAPKPSTEPKLAGEKGFERFHDLFR